MNAKEIDKFFEAFKNEDLEYVWKCADMQEEFAEEKLLDDETAVKVLVNVYEKIKQGDYKHFLEKMEYADPVTTEVIENLLIYSHDAEAIKHLLSKRAQLGIDKWCIETLIIATQDLDFIDECIENKEIYDMDTYDVIEILKKIKNPEYTDKYIEKREKMGFYRGDIIELICSINDPAYREKYIERREEFKLNRGDVFNLIRYTTDTRYLDKYISQRKELMLSKKEVLYLIAESKQPDYIDKWLDKREELELEKADVIYLIGAINEPSQLDKYIERAEEFELDKKDIVSIISKLSNVSPTYIDKYIEKREAYGFDKNDILYLINRLEAPEPAYIKRYIVNANKYGFTKDDVIHLIVKTNNTTFMEQCLNKSDELGFDEKDILKLSIAMGKEELIDNLIKGDETEIILPEDMTIGMEIESVGVESEWIRSKGQFDEWHCKGDGSLRPDNIEESGVEIVSPILKGDTKQTSEQIKRVCAILEGLGQYTNETCGGHIHIGADYLKSPQAMRNLMELWSNTEKALFIVSNKEGEIPREGIPRYASPISGTLEEQINEGSIDIADEQDLSILKEKLVQAQEDRYRGINFKNLEESEIGTIEFRLPNGTISAKTWIENANLFGGIIKAAQDLSIVQEKTPFERTEEEQHMIEGFEKLRNGELKEKEALMQLLEIAVPEKQREVYIKRYETNSELLKENPEREKELRGKIAKGKVNISKKQIGKEIYTGENRITGQEQSMTEAFLSREMETERYSQEID